MGSGGANVGLQHLGRIANCSEVPDTCVFCTFQGFLDVLGCAVRNARCWRILQWALQKLPGIYPVPAREIPKHGWFF